MFSVHESKVTAIELPGRRWFYLVGPDNCGAKGICFGLAEFPAKTTASSHVHTAEEEVIFVLSGRGKLVGTGGEAELVPGTAAYVPPGEDHQVINEGEDLLKIVTLFCPPVRPGSYDRASR